MSQNILEAIDEEIARLHQVRAILTGSKLPIRGAAATAAEETPARPRRQLSPKARRAIAEAQRRRWEKVHLLKKAMAPDPIQNESAAG